MAKIGNLFGKNRHEKDWKFSLGDWLLQINGDGLPKDTYQEILRLNVSMYNGSLVQVVQRRGEVTHHGAGILLSVAGGTGNGIKQVTTLQIYHVEGLGCDRENTASF